MEAYGSAIGIGFTFTFNAEASADEAGRRAAQKAVWDIQDIQRKHMSAPIPGRDSEDSTCAEGTPGNVRALCLGNGTRFLGLLRILTPP